MAATWRQRPSAKPVGYKLLARWGSLACQGLSTLKMVPLIAHPFSSDLRYLFRYLTP
jgi:hypothetical protein